MSKLLLVVALLAATFANAQDFFPPLGNYTLDEFRMKECSFDKDATAVILLHAARTDYDDDRRLLTTHHIRIKILKEKGIEYANVSIPFIRREDFEYIDRIQGLTINPLPGGDVEKHYLESKSIFFEKSSANLGEVKFSFPAAKVGSIIEYTYRSNMKHYGGLQDWWFQSYIPVVKSKYNLIIVPGVEFAYQVQKSATYPVNIKPNNDGKGSVFFEMNNVAGLTDEPYMDARGDYIQKVVFQLAGISREGHNRRYSTTWPELARDLLGDDVFGRQLGRALPDTDEFVKDVKSLSSPKEKINKVCNYVKDRMVWNGTNSKYSIDGVKSAWNKRTGNSADINLILVNLLRAAGLDADPVLVSERYHGRVRTNYPFVDQFNTVYAFVTANNHNYYLDATKKYLAVDITPSEILNTTGFIVDARKPRIVNILDEAFKYEETVLIQGKLIPEGKLEGRATVKSLGYARAMKVSKYKSDNKKFIERYYTKAGTEGIVVDSFKTKGEDIDSLPFIQEFEFSLPIVKTGEYSLLDLNLFTVQKNNPFILDDRFSNINFGYKQRYLLTSIIDVPSVYVVDVLPKPLKMIAPDTSISFQKSTSFEDGQLVQKVLIEFNVSLFDSDEYPMVKEFYKRMYDALNESIVLKKK